MDTKKIINELYFCAAQCMHCYDGCQMEKEKSELERCMMFDKDCEEICRLTAQLLERNSENAEYFLKLCAEMCERCAAECEKHNHEHCKKCTEACRKCADTCNSYQPVN